MVPKSGATWGRKEGGAQGSESRPINRDLLVLLSFHLAIQALRVLAVPHLLVSGYPCPSPFALSSSLPLATSPFSPLTLPLFRILRLFSPLVNSNSP